MEPAFLALSDKQGGFPRYGFYLEDGDGGGVAKPESAYIDLHRRSTPTGRFGAIDQIFPHELLHVIVRRTAGELPEGGANQVHALAVRTDPVTAFNEGFAEHAQVMAIDDEDAAAETRALKNDAALRDRAFAAFAAYERAMSARWAAGALHVSAVVQPVGAGPSLPRREGEPARAPAGRAAAAAANGRSLPCVLADECRPRFGDRALEAASRAVVQRRRRQHLSSGAG